MAELGNSFKDFEDEVPYLKILRQEDADKIKKRFNSLKIERSADDLGKFIGFDNFVNIRPQ